MRVIAVVNRKGGVGKTTTTAALMNGLYLKGYRVLAIDLDAQMHLTKTMGIRTFSKTVLRLLLGECEVREAIGQTDIGDIIPASKLLSGADKELIGERKEYRLKDALEPVAAEYDFCIIDCPPALGILTVNALVAANSVIIPAQADFYSICGIEDLQETIVPVRIYCNPELKIGGILLTRYNPRTVLARDAKTLTEQLAEKLGTSVYKTTIREGTAVKEAQIMQKGLFKYSPRAKVTLDYKAFIEEFLEKEGNT